MTPRSRIPTIFSIYMLDVICCALGCVILLWQLKHVEAEEQTEAAQQQHEAAKQAQDRWQVASTQYDSANAEIAALRSQLRESHQRYDLLSAENVRVETDRDAQRRLVAVTKQDYDKLRQAYLISETLLKDVRIDLERAEQKQKLTAVALADKVKANAELLLQVGVAQKQVQTLEKQTATQKIDVAEAAKRLQEQLARLREIELKGKALEKQAADLRAAEKDATARLVTHELRAKVLEQELDKNRKVLATHARDTRDAQAAIAALEKEKLVLVEKARLLQLEADQRFAGIALSGKNVLFMVDMSGSMAMTDEKTDDPDKWPLVCETVVQLMRSIKGLQFFQVLLFSDRVRYPLGNDASWLKYDARETPQKTLAALKATRPDGETNMHAAFAEAFRYREAKLDTIYVLSDGLPNAGDGLPANLSEAERTTILSKHLRYKLKNDWNRPMPGQPRVRINSIGFFFESPDVGAFLWALSREHDGSFVGMSK